LNILHRIDELDPDTLTHLETYLNDEIALPREINLLDVSQPEVELDQDFSKTKTKYKDNLINHIPAHLGYTSSKTNEALSLRPSNLFESYLEQFCTEGLFDQTFEMNSDTNPEGLKKVLESDDLTSVISCIRKDIRKPKRIKAIWPRYTEKRLNRCKSIIYKMNFQNMPDQFKKFDEIWSKLTKKQEDANILRYFYEDQENPIGAEEIAKALKIKPSSLKDRLNGAYKHFEKLYPEFKRVPMRKASQDKQELQKSKTEKKQNHEIAQWLDETGLFIGVDRGVEINKTPEFEEINFKKLTF